MFFLAGLSNRRWSKPLRRFILPSGREKSYLDGRNYGPAGGLESGEFLGHLHNSG
jgi:hypothetical protein